MAIETIERKIVLPKKKLKQVQNVQKCKPKNIQVGINYKLKAMTAEQTGLGNDLILETSFGRLFRSDEECVRDEVNEFIYLYKAMCHDYDDDPRPENRAILEINELYYSLGILPLMSKVTYGFPITQEYRVPMEIDMEHITDDHLAAKFGEPYFRIEFREGSYPEPWDLDY